jgi:hypothetical protein
MSRNRVRTAYVVVGFSLVFFSMTGWLASRKPFWTDELHVVNSASVSTVAEVWSSLVARPDAMPPLVHLLTHFVYRTLGLNHLTARLPAMAGYWLLCVCIFFLLRRRVPIVVATMGMLLPVTVPGAYAYAIEARGYGLLLGFSALAVLCWDAAGKPSSRWISLVGLCLSLAAAIASHLFAVLLVVPLALAEIARSWERRRIDPWVWVSMAASGSVLFTFASLLPNMERIGQMMAAPAGLSVFTLVSIWEQFLSTPLTYVGLVVLMGASSLVGAYEHPADVPELRQISASDYVLAIALSCLPLIGFVFGVVVTGVINLRYVLPTVIGLSIVIPLIVRKSARDERFGWLFLGWVLFAALYTVYDVKRQMLETGDIARGRGIYALLAYADRIPRDGRPIVVTDYHSFMALDHYSPPELKPRLAFIADYDAWILPDAELHEKLYGQHMSSLDAFVRNNRSFYVYDCDTAGRKSPLIPHLITMGARLEDSHLIDVENTFPRPGYLYLVSEMNSEALDRPAHN